MVPARRSNEPTARKRARRILGALFLAASLGVVAVFVALAKGRTTPDLSAVDPKGRELAYISAVSYLAGGNQNVPHTNSMKPDDLAQAGPHLLGGKPSAALPYQSVSWVGFTPEHFGSAKAGFTDFEVHHFLVTLADPLPVGTPQPTPTPSASPKVKATSPTRGAGRSKAPQSVPGAPAPTDSALSPAPTDSAGATSADPSQKPTGDGIEAPATNVLKLDVPVLITEQGPRLSAAPAFSVWTSGVGAPAGVGDYTNYTNLVTDVSEAVKTQVATWAKVYVTGDSGGLLAVTGDQDGHHRYVGLNGFTLPDSGQAVQILSAIKAANGQLVVRARVLLARTVSGGTVTGNDGTTPQFVTFADFDLLVGAPAGAQPPILAWGPAGSAAELEPYSNALSS
jgi:hypothetical protein